MFDTHSHSLSLSASLSLSLSFTHSLSLSLSLSAFPMSSSLSPMEALETCQTIYTADPCV